MGKNIGLRTWVHFAKFAVLMIRFECSNCGKSLRAPVVLAGKKGRCAQCGTVNPVPGALAGPIVLSVDVKRAAAPSPFRSTADYEAERVTIEASVQTAALADDALEPPARLERPSRAFFDAAPLQIDSEPATFEGEEWEEPPVRSRARGSTAGLGTEPMHAGFDPHFEQRAHEVWRVVVAAMLVGGVVGFCVGLFCSKWIL